MTEKQASAENLPAVQSATPMPVSVRGVKSNADAIHRLMREVLKNGMHYGVIPGTPKPSLYKPGAEKISVLFHLAPSFTRQMQWEPPHLTVISECTLTSQETGKIIASAGAMCTTRETKYAFRQATRKCPECGKATIIKGKKEYGGGWICFAKKGGCGAKWEDGAKEIESQSEDREENPNLPDTYNTVMKMADKRAYVAATLFGTAASDIFTQDVEDFGAYQDPGDGGAVVPPVDSELPSDEFESLILDMEAAFERGEGRDWWRANGRSRALCSDGQALRLKDRARELAEGTGQTTKPAPEPPKDEGPQTADLSPEPPEYLHGKQGQTTKEFRAAWRNLHKAWNESPPFHDAYMEEAQEAIAALHASEQKALNAEYERMSAHEQDHNQPDLGV